MGKSPTVSLGDNSITGNAMPRKKKRNSKKRKAAADGKLKTPKKAVDHKPVESEASNLSLWSTDRASYIFLIGCVIAQLATILITWPTWLVREFPVNLPWIAGTPQMSMGVLLIISLVLVVVAPKKFGMVLHLGVMLVAIAMDQFRCQPQVLSITVLMMACVWKPIRQLCIWYLVSMWLWTGIHKMLSPDWFGYASVDLLKRMQLVSPYEYNIHFAIIVAVSEIGLGVLAFLRPRLAAFLCVALHAGIAIFLFRVNWNFSVLPWNLCTAIVGGWLLWNASTSPSQLLQSPQRKWQLVILAALMIVPAGFYFGLVRNCFSHVLYSDNLPIAAITRSSDEVEILDGWDDFAFPFPHEKAAFVAYLKASGQPGQKLHVLEPRNFVEGGYFVVQANRQIKQIDEASFFATKNDSVAGFGCDDPRAILQLELANVRMRKRAWKTMVFSAQFEAEKFDSKLLDLLSGLPNLEEIQLEGCQISDEDVKKLLKLPKLNRLGLNDTPITLNGIRHLKELEFVEMIHFRGVVFRSIDEVLADEKE